jgi:hypothetical protein
LSPLLWIPWVKRQRQSPPSSSETFTPPYVFMAWCCIKHTVLPLPFSRQFARWYIAARCGTGTESSSRLGGWPSFRALLGMNKSPRVIPRPDELSSRERKLCWVRSCPLTQVGRGFDSKPSDCAVNWNSASCEVTQLVTLIKNHDATSSVRDTCK